MITHSSKKIYIIGSNPNDFFDLTIEAINILSKSNIIIYSKKFEKLYEEVLLKNKKKILFEEDLADSKMMLLKAIHNLSETYDSISHLITGDPFLFFENTEELFLKKRKIQVEKVLGIPEIILWINKKNLFLTNRNKNSSVSFFFPKTKKDCKKLLHFRNFEKLIIKISVESIFQNIKEILLNRQDKNFKYKVFVNSKEVKLNNRLKLDKSFSDVYIILENVKI